SSSDTPQAPPKNGNRSHEGHGRRLTGAFAALEAFPALAESRDRVLRLLGEDRLSAGEMVAAVETDIALTIAVMRLASQTDAGGSIDSVVAAVRGPTPQAVYTLVTGARTYDFFERTGV